ncbi:hypothetical protein Tco_0367751 [Tanacetum coccineum]
MESQNKGTTTIKSCLKASQIRNIEGKTLGKDGKPLVPMRQATRVTNLGPGTKGDEGKEIQGGDAAPPVTSADGTYDKVVTGNVTSLGDKQKHVHVNEASCWEDPNVHAMKSSFVNIVSAEEEVPKLNFRTLISTSQVEDADCVLPVASVIDAQNNFENSLVGFFVGKSVAFQLDKVTKVPLWVKIHKVPVVAYSADGLSLNGTQIGKLNLLDAFTSLMCKDPWGRIGYARALIEVSAEKELKKEVTMAIPIVNGVGHTIETIKVEYEWKPSCCCECHVFGHALENCPKRVVESAKETNVENEDGFTTVKSRKRKGKRADTVQARNFEGIKLSKPKPNFVWSVKSNQASTTSKKATTDDEIPDTTNKKATDVVLINSFNFLAEEDRADWNDEITWQNAKRAVNVINESDSEDVDQEIVLETHPGQYAKGESTLSKDVSHVWTSNGSWCSKGTRIILGWNSNNVDINVVSQDDQAARVWIKADKKEVFCSFIYAHNRYSQRRALWENLGKHKVYVRNRLWCLLGDFNAALNIEDKSMGSSNIDISMREFKECVENIEVLDIPRSGLQYTWNQKPKGSSGLLKNLDRVMANMEFNDAFVGGFCCLSTVPFMDVVKMGWSIHVSGFLMYRVVKKLKYLKKPFCKLLYEKGNLHDNVERLRMELDQRFLKQKAKVEWLRVGDSNSAYFHKAIKSRISRNRINVVTTLEGETFTDENVAKAFVNHYEVFLGQPGITTPFCDVNLFYNRLDVEDAAAMVRPVTSQEVKEAMFLMGNDKAPGPDGYTAAFLRNLGILFLRMLLWPFKSSLLMIIANRIKECLKGLISPNQSAFVPGRRISDNILLTQELMHNYHLDRGTPRCAFKVDIQKAYDTVDWEFLRMVLISFGFHNQMITWIMECVSTTSYSVCVNGDLHGYFKGKRGLRQGDPLSPYLFTLIMEVFTLMLKRRARESPAFTYHRYCSDLELINLCFADDLFIFAHGDPESATVIMEALDEFKNASGLVMSLPKSTAYFCNVLNYTKHAIIQILPFEEGRLHVKYLGVPLVSSRLIYRDCKELIEKVQHRIRDWKNKSLSAAGRLQLVKSVIGSMHVYWASVFILPSRVLLDFKQLMRNFLWAQGESQKGNSKVKDVIYNGGWAWPIELSSKYPLFSTIVVPTVSTSLDTLEWHSNGGASMPFSVETVWNCLRPRDVVVPWYNVVWDSMKVMAGLSNVMGSITIIVDTLIPMSKHRSAQSVIAKLVVAACCYYIWQERNFRLFKNKKRSPQHVINCIKASVRLKLLSCYFKKSKDVMEVIRLWGLPDSLIR